MASISSILMAQGQHAAESRNRRASQWVPLLQHLASLPGQVMQDRRAEQDRSVALADAEQARKARGLQITAAERAETTAKATDEQKRQMNDLLATPGIIGKDNTFDVAAAQRVATEKGYRDIFDDVMAFGQDWNEGVQKGLLTQAQIDAAKRSHQPAPAEPYTLNPGDRRFGPDNKEVASVPAEVKPDMRALNLQLKDAIERNDKPAMNAIRQAIREAAEAGRDPNSGSGGTPYFIPLQTGQGVISFDTRTGQAAGRIADLKPGEAAQREIANATTTGTILKQVIGSLDPAKVGPAMGRYKTAQAMLTGGDPQFAAFSAAVSTLQNTVIQLRTGAAMSEPEAARILNEISNVNLPPDTFVAKAKQAEKYFDEWLRNRARGAYGRTTTGDVDRMVAPAPNATGQPPPAPAGGAPTYQDYLRSRGQK